MFVQLYMLRLRINFMHTASNKIISKKLFAVSFPNNQNHYVHLLMADLKIPRMKYQVSEETAKSLGMIHLKVSLKRHC